MKPEDFEIIKINRPSKKDAGHDRTLIVYFYFKNIVNELSYTNVKFRLSYEQRHYYYDGMPGIIKGHYSMSKIKDGEIKNIYCSKDLHEFGIPHYTPEGEIYYPSGYGGYIYEGEEMCNISDEDIINKLIIPYFEIYY